jgi:tetratricopeptide (TPR) repeat protein
VRGLAALLLTICLPVAGGAPNSQWTLVRSSHFEVYSQSSERDGKRALLWLEQLRAFFVGLGVAQSGRDLESHGPIRVIGFRSPSEYAAFRLRPAADAYFIGGETTDYIVMPQLSSAEFGLAAHEYGHLVLRSFGLQLPPWLAEGIAEFFSTVRIGEQGCSIGGDLPMRALALRRGPWIPLERLLGATKDSALFADRNDMSVFYAESWALTDMLILSPAYAAKFNQLLETMAFGGPGAAALAGVYAKSLSAVMADLRGWMEKARSGVQLAGIPAANPPVEVSGLTNFESRRMIADLLFAGIDLGRAKAAYKALANERPEDARVAAALGSIAFKEGDRNTAREQWKRAIQLGIGDAGLYYQFAILAEDAGVPTEEIVEALRRAIELRPEFDDARYKLALLESNCGHYEAALEQLRAMRPVPAGRAFGYWTAMATALNETDQREAAKEAAVKAIPYAKTEDERALVSSMRYVADTDLTVRFSRDANGNLQMVTARKPHGADDWNPFIEPGDRMVHVEGQIRKVECSAGRITGFTIESAAGAVEVALPDPAHVLIGGGRAEFVCDAEDGRKVAIEYAAFEKHTTADGVLRGMQFR